MTTDLIAKALIKSKTESQIPRKYYKLGRSTLDLILDIESGVSEDQMLFRGKPIKYNAEDKTWDFVESTPKPTGM